MRNAFFLALTLAGCALGSPGVVVPPSPDAASVAGGDVDTLSLAATGAARMVMKRDTVEPVDERSLMGRSLLPGARGAGSNPAAGAAGDSVVRDFQIAQTLSLAAGAAFNRPTNARQGISGAMFASGSASPQGITTLTTLSARILDGPDQSPHTPYLYVAPADSLTVPAFFALMDGGIPAMRDTTINWDHWFAVAQAKEAVFERPDSSAVLHFPIMRDRNYLAIAVRRRLTNDAMGTVVSTGVTGSRVGRIGGNPQVALWAFVSPDSIADTTEVILRFWSTAPNAGNPCVAYVVGIDTVYYEGCPE